MIPMIKVLSLSLYLSARPTPAAISEAGRPAASW